MVVAVDVVVGDSDGVVFSCLLSPPCSRASTFEFVLDMVPEVVLLGMREVSSLMSLGDYCFVI